MKECHCEFAADPDDPDEDTPEKSWHFRRFCHYCNREWFGLHCPHDGYQNPCPHCGERPAVVAPFSMRCVRDDVARCPQHGGIHLLYEGLP